MAEEARLIEQIRKFVKNSGGKVIKIHTTGVSEKGIPDLVVCIPSLPTFFVETKSKGKKPTKLQLAKIKEIQKAGGIAFWCDNLADFINNLPIL